MKLGRRRSHFVAGTVFVIVDVVRLFDVPLERQVRLLIGNETMPFPQILSARAYC